MAKHIEAILSVCILALTFNLIECDYEISRTFPGGIDAYVIVNISADVNGWEVVLTYDNTVKLTIYEGGTIKSSKDNKEFTIVNDDKYKSLKAGSQLKLRIEFNFLNNPGAHLIKATFQGKEIGLSGLLPPSLPAETVLSIGTKGSYDLNKVLTASLLFYEAQRSGKLPASNRIKWRGDSMLDDKGDAGEDLTGGYFDAGDHVKFGFPMAFTVTVLSWGAIDYESAYSKAGELENVKSAIKWGTDYFIKAHVKDTEFYGQVGKGGDDHAYWGRPEDWPKEKKRPAYKITAAKPGSDLAGETAAALAAASIVFKKSEPDYSTKLLTHAKTLYSFANKNRGVYHESITDVTDFYKSWSGYGDELGWSAAWLLRATNDSTYKTDFEKHWNDFKLYLRPEQFSWDDKTAGLQLIMAKVTGDEKYKTVVKNYTDWLLSTAPKSPKGMIYLDQWGTLRHASAAAFVALQAADLGINAATNRDFAKSQIGYALGDTGRSFVVGVGTNPPQRPHHRAASCPLPPAGCNQYQMSYDGPSPHILTGALVGGPDKSDSYKDDRSDYVHNEVACDYNAGFQSAVAGLAMLK